MSNLPSWYIEITREQIETQLPDWYRDKYAPAPDKPTPLTGQARTTGPEQPNLSKSPRGIRNNNPGNIEIGEKWQGIAKGDEVQSFQVKEDRFIVFSSPEFGVRAVAKILQTYRVKHGLSTVRGIINRWAPPFENDTEAYISSVAKTIGVSPDAKIDTSSPHVLNPLIGAIIRHENGEQPYSEETITAGINLALNIEE